MERVEGQAYPAGDEHDRNASQEVYFVEPSVQDFLDPADQAVNLTRLEQKWEVCSCASRVQEPLSLKVLAKQWDGYQVAFCL